MENIDLLGLCEYLCLAVTGLETGSVGLLSGCLQGPLVALFCHLLAIRRMCHTVGDNDGGDGDVLLLILIKQKGHHAVITWKILL